MKYTSTRGQSPALSFSDAVLAGLAPDGGLYVPERLPSLPTDWRLRWRNATYVDIATDLFVLYIDPADIPHSHVRQLVDRTFGPASNTWASQQVTPLHLLRDSLSGKPDVHILELFHGPTLAFKDIALQFLGHLFEYILVRKASSTPITVVGATSGDTGSAAIAGLCGKSNIRVCILHPHGKVSPVQAAQMTSILHDNVCNIAMDGTFDDCQAMVKALFNDPTARKEFHLAAVNSINIARIIAQISYYVVSYLRLEHQFGQDSVAHNIIYAVPSGNFGDVLAGYYAKRMGLPLGPLVVATNANDILHRFLTTGKYSPDPFWQPATTTVKPVHALATVAPAMDITVASNFERVLYDWVDGDTRQVQQWMHELDTNGGFVVPEVVAKRAKSFLISHHVSDAEIIDTITDTYARTGYVLDPHTAVGVHSIHHFRSCLSATTSPDGQQQLHWFTPPPVCLATAHPGKFLSTVGEAVARVMPPMTKEAEVQAKFVPQAVRNLESLPRRWVRIQGNPDPHKVAAVLRSPWPQGELVAPAQLVAKL